jgi:GNAT superfamily N-acetyltransferase
MAAPDQNATAWQPRLARPDDIPALETLIPLSVRALQAHCYSPAQIEAALVSVFGLDRQLIHDQTYFVVEKDSQILGAGGWSKRQTLSGGDRGRTEIDPELDPARDPARVRAFFVHPQGARRGIARAILAACERATIAAHFCDAVTVATLAGEPLYASFGYTVTRRYSLPLPDGLHLPVVHMSKRLPRLPG